MLKKLLPMIAPMPHVCYCEPFAGGLAVLMAKERSAVEVVNDINGDLIALYMNLQRHLPELLRHVDSFVSSRQLFHLFTKQPGVTEIERAARFLLRNRISFGGNMHSFAVAKTKRGGACFNRETASELLRQAHVRLDKVVIENISYERSFENYDSKDTLHFIDPPYLHAKTDAYKGWDESDLKTFRRRVDKLKGKWIVTLDDSAFNRELFSDCHIEGVISNNRSVNNRTHAQQTFGELIITASK